MSAYREDMRLGEAADYRAADGDGQPLGDAPYVWPAANQIPTSDWAWNRFSGLYWTCREGDSMPVDHPKSRADPRPLAPALDKPIWGVGYGTYTNDMTPGQYDRAIGRTE